MKELNLPKAYKFLFLGVIILFLAGIILMVWASQLSEYELRGNYRWTINALSEGGEQVDLDDVQITYKFSEEEGSLSFHPRDQIDKLIIHFPENLKENVTLRIHKNHSWETLPVTLPTHKQNERKATIVFSEKNIEEWIIVDFKMDLSPNAMFDISKNSHWYYGQIYFDFGKEFECLRDNCAFNIWHLKTVKENRPSVNSLRLQMVNQTPVGGHLHKFETSARSLNIINLKNFGISMGASLIVGAIFAIFSIIIGIIQHPRKKNGKKRK